MKKILAFLTSLIFYLCFGCSLVIFHLIQWIALNLFGYRAHKFTIELLNRILLLWMKILGTKISFEITTALPEDRPLIFVANHQSTYDIPPLIWHLRKYHPKFISKIELGKGIPSVSFNLRHGGSVLIDRKKPKEALQKIKAFGKTINKKKYSAVIFPEGTRSKDGSTRKFQKSGLICLFESMPNAMAVPISIGNSWKFGHQNYFPMPMGVNLKITVHKAQEINRKNPVKFIETLEHFIEKEVRDKQAI